MATVNGGVLTGSRRNRFVAWRAGDSVNWRGGQQAALAISKSKTRPVKPVALPERSSSTMV